MLPSNLTERTGLLPRRPAAGSPRQSPRPRGRAPLRALLAAVSAFSLAACGAAPGDAERNGRAAAGGAARPWVETDPAAVRAGGPRVLVYHDMEGLSGQSDPNTFRSAKGALYAQGRELLTADVNAVIDGLYAGGAAEVHVVDAHGSGSPEPDLLLDRLDPRAQMVFRDRPFRQYVDLVEPGVYDAIAVVGMHAKTGSGGFASHTYTLGMDILMNGQSITETELIAFAWGRVGVPVIFASGDDRLAGDLQTMPWIRFVTVKTATSASTADPRPVDEARAELRAVAREALENRAAARAVRLTEPVRTGLRVVAPASVAMLEGVPGLEFGGDAVHFTAPDFQAAYDGVIALIGVARGGYQQVLFETVRAHPDGEAILSGYSDALFDRWLDYESGRWAPPAAAASSPAGRRYHGAN